MQRCRYHRGRIRSRRVIRLLSAEPMPSCRRAAPAPEATRQPPHPATRHWQILTATVEDGCRPGQARAQYSPRLRAFGSARASDPGQLDEPVWLDAQEMAVVRMAARSLSWL